VVVVLSTRAAASVRATELKLLASIGMLHQVASLINWYAFANIGGAICKTSEISLCPSHFYSF
jgi:hypothetical protein